MPLFARGLRWRIARTRVDTSVSDSPKPAVDRSTSGGLSSAELAAEPTSGGYQELEWDDLIPLDWQPDKLMSDLDADTLSDDDPRAQELMEKLQALWREAPVVQELNARRVRLPGFVVPLDMDASSMGNFCWCLTSGPASMFLHRRAIQTGLCRRQRKVRNTKASSSIP